MKRFAICLAAFSAFMGVVQNPAFAEKIYWSRYAYGGGIQRANLDGTEFEDVVTGVGGVAGIALDVADEKLYWTNISLDKIQRSNLDGTGIQDVVAGLPRPEGIALDLTERKLYWADAIGTGKPGKIQRANLEGTEVQDVLTGLTYPSGIALDIDAGKIYWAESLPGSIRRANLDGTGVEVVLSGLQIPHEIALDLRPIPEPSTVFLLFTGGAAFLGYAFKWRRRKAAGSTLAID